MNNLTTTLKNNITNHTPMTALPTSFDNVPELSIFAWLFPNQQTKTTTFQHFDPITGFTNGTIPANASCLTYIKVGKTSPHVSDDVTHSFQVVTQETIKFLPFSQFPDYNNEFHVKLQHTISYPYYLQSATLLPPGNTTDIKPGNANDQNGAATTSAISSIVAVLTMLITFII